MILLVINGLEKGSEKGLPSFVLFPHFFHFFHWNRLQHKSPLQYLIFFLILIKQMGLGQDGVELE